MTAHKRFALQLPSGRLVLGKRTLVMGVLNVTPDSFSDPGEFFDANRAIEQAFQMERDGADVLDIGAESTRPGSEGTNAEEEWRRLQPVFGAIGKKIKIPISIDTQKPEIAERALQAGAQIINDISGLKSDPRLATVAARHKVPLILMHMRGEPRTMQQAPFARNALQDVTQGLRKSLRIALAAGVSKSQILVDPGIGFGKSFRQNYELIANLEKLAKLGYPLVIGTSRKGFIGATLAHGAEPAPVAERIWGTAATVTASILNGAHIVRVHDVAEMVKVARVADCVVNPRLAPQNKSS